MVASFPSSSCPRSPSLHLPRHANLPFAFLAFWSRGYQCRVSFYSLISWEWQLGRFEAPRNVEEPKLHVRIVLGHLARRGPKTGSGVAASRAPLGYYPLGNEWPANIEVPAPRGADLERFRRLRHLFSRILSAEPDPPREHILTVSFYLTSVQRNGRVEILTNVSTCGGSCCPGSAHASLYSGPRKPNHPFLRRIPSPNRRASRRRCRQEPGASFASKTVTSRADWPCFQAPSNPTNTVFDIKRLIVRYFGLYRTELELTLLLCRVAGSTTRTCEHRRFFAARDAR